MKKGKGHKYRGITLDPAAWFPPQDETGLLTGDFSSIRARRSASHSRMWVERRRNMLNQTLK